ncbi:DUF1775 domain-containing protein [Kitasatospora sp. NPDC051853]|uniref:DUF1775 domain-containing protein n=1 Tax=Kitasatospora sp. NPDC051853 TaxID=3364058 RepID=UPI0037883E24
MTVNRIPSPLPVLRRGAAAALAATALLVAVAGPASAHAGVSASDPRRLAENVTVTFKSEAESTTAGVTSLQVVLPEGIPAQGVSLKSAPTGWTLTPTENGYTVAGPALEIGTDAEHSILVRQLPDADALVFKTVETYGDGKVSRWIALPADAAKSDNPAPVLKLRAAAPGATPVAAPSPTAAATVAAPPTPTETPAATLSPSDAASTAQEVVQPEEDGGVDTGTVMVVVAAVVVLVVVALGWSRRRGADRR